MFALLTHWKLRYGCPPQLQAAIEELTCAVESEEPGTLFYSVSLPGPHPPIGPPPEYAVSPEVVPTPPRDMNELVFFEIYRDDKAFSDHLRGAFAVFMHNNRHFFQTPWQGHPRPKTICLDLQCSFARAALVGSEPEVVG